MLTLDLIKLIALDLDGTLLNPGAIISPDTIAEFLRLQKKGIYVGIATGRPIKATLELLTMNGITPDLGLIQFLICEERDIYFLKDDQYKPHNENQSAFDEELHCLALSKHLIKIAENDPQQIGFYMNNNVLHEKRGFVEVICTSVQDSRSLNEMLEALSFNTPIRPIRNSHGVSLRSRKVGKGITLAKVASMLSLSPNEVLAMGDSHNDWDMLSGDFQAATTQNADEEIKIDNAF